MRQLTIRGARFANEDHSAAVLDTTEAADVLISASDTPELWAQMLACGVAVAPFGAMDTRRQDRHREDMGKPVIIKGADRLEDTAELDNGSIASRRDIDTISTRQHIIRFTLLHVGDKVAKHLHAHNDSHTSVVAKGAILVRTTGYPDLILRAGDFIDWPAGTEHEWECMEAPAILFNHFQVKR